jgi:hypothetical protein
VHWAAVGSTAVIIERRWAIMVVLTAMLHWLTVIGVDWTTTAFVVFHYFFGVNRAAATCTTTHISMAMMMMSTCIRLLGGKGEHDCHEGE